MQGFYVYSGVEVHTFENVEKRYINAITQRWEDEIGIAIVLVPSALAATLVWLFLTWMMTGNNVIIPFIACFVALMMFFWLAIGMKDYRAANQVLRREIMEGKYPRNQMVAQKDFSFRVMSMLYHHAISFEDLDRLFGAPHIIAMDEKLRTYVMVSDMDSLMMCRTLQEQILRESLVLGDRLARGGVVSEIVDLQDEVAAEFEATRTKLMSSKEGRWIS